MSRVIHSLIEEPWSPALGHADQRMSALHQLSASLGTGLTRSLSLIGRESGSMASCGPAFCFLLYHLSSLAFCLASSLSSGVTTAITAQARGPARAATVPVEDLHTRECIDQIVTIVGLLGHRIPGELELPEEGQPRQLNYLLAASRVNQFSGCQPSQYLRSLSWL